MRPFIVGICGGSGSGKTHLLRLLMEAIDKEEICLISQDNYYKPLVLQKRDEEGLINFDHPDSLKLDELERDIAKLRRGESFEMREFMFNLPPESGKMLYFSPKPLIILEGIFIYYPESLRELIDLKIFVEADEYIRLCRRIGRDQEERGYEASYIINTYQKYVGPMYRKYILPTKENCDLIIPNNHSMDRAVQVLVTYLKNILSEYTYEK